MVLYTCALIRLIIMSEWGTISQKFPIPCFQSGYIVHASDTS